jgi:hypothetical protein
MAEDLVVHELGETLADAARVPSDEPSVDVL